MMRRIYVLCEGQTEETFIKEVLSRHFHASQKLLIPILTRNERGGLTSYEQTKREIIQLCKQHSSAYVTTMFDLYALPNDFPGITTNLRGIGKANHLEQCLSNDIGQRRFIPYISVHEFEALLFSAPHKFKDWFDDKSVQKIKKDRDAHVSPEHINEDPLNAPSKRLLRYCRDYEKVLHGSLISLDIGLDPIRQQCAHFNDWLVKLENL